MWFLLEQCEIKIRVQTFNQSNTVDLGKVLFADSLIYKYFSIGIWLDILDEYCLQILAYLNETSPVWDYRLVNQVSSLITRSIQIKLSGVIWTDSGVHKGFGFCVMLLTDINETTDSSDDWLWALFNSADFEMLKMLVRNKMVLAGTAGWQTRV